MLRILLNILWFIFGGRFLIWLSYALVGVLLCISIVGIPTSRSLTGGSIRKLLHRWILKNEPDDHPKQLPQAVGLFI